MGREPNPPNETPKRSQTPSKKIPEKDRNQAVEKQRSRSSSSSSRRNMSIFQVFDMREKVIKREGAGAVCPCCGGPVVATHLDCNLHVCCVPVSRKTKTKYSCAICSRSLIVTR